jgi:Ca-activated chloride channel family protein
MLNFAAPWWLLLLLVVVAAIVGYVVVQLRRKRYTARFSNAQLLASVAPRRPGWRRHLTFVLLVSGLAVLTLALAQPTAKVRVPRDRATVMLAIDVSRSMMATDVLPSRIEAAKSAAKAFVDLLPSRINVGLVKFAGTASVVAPPTTDRETVKTAIDLLELADSTATGDGIASSLDAITVFSKATTAKDDKPAPSRIVLMSDGHTTKGQDPLDAAVTAKRAGVAVSTIAFGTDNGTVVYEGETIPVPADKVTLQEVARETGGTFHAAASAQELRDVYADIGSQIGYTTVRKIITWRFLLVGLILLFGASGTSLLWGGRLA